MSAAGVTGQMCLWFLLTIVSSSAERGQAAQAGGGLHDTMTQMAHSLAKYSTPFKIPSTGVLHSS